MSRDLHNNLKHVVALNLAAIAANTATNGAVVDRIGFQAVEFALQSGTITDGTYAVKIQHGDLANGSDMADAPARDVLGDAISFVAADDNVIKTIGYVGDKPYCRIVVTSSGVTTGGTLGAQAVLGSARRYPV